MSFKEFMNLYDDWNGRTRVNGDNLEFIIEGNTYDVVCKYQYLWNKEVVAFGFYNNVLTVRIK